MTPSLRAAKKLAKSAGLRYVSDDQPGIRRTHRGRGFSYEYDSGRPVRDAKLKRRLQALAIPPAWTDVWICRDVNGHLQATGRDDRDRKQYIYHPKWSEAATLDKFERLEKLGKSLPKIRRTVSKHLRKGSKPRERTLALVVRLLELTGMRVGGESYLAENGSRGLTTLSVKHLRDPREESGISIYRQRGQAAAGRDRGSAYLTHVEIDDRGRYRRAICV